MYNTPRRNWNKNDKNKYKTWCNQYVGQEKYSEQTVFERILLNFDSKALANFYSLDYVAMLIGRAGLDSFKPSQELLLVLFYAILVL